LSNASRRRWQAACSHSRNNAGHAVESLVERITQQARNLAVNLDERFEDIKFLPQQHPRYNKGLSRE
jgi:hypothetical protein